MVVSNMKLEYAKDNLTQQPYRHYLKRYQETSPRVISESSGLVFHEKEQAFLIRFMGVLYQVTHPGFQIRHQEPGNGIYMLEENIDAQILLLRYLLDGNAVMSSGKLISYHDLPWGEVYYRQFQGRCIFRLARNYGTRLSEFRRIMESLHGVRKETGDAAYEFEFLEDLKLCLILWEGEPEEGFPPSAQILFSDNFPAAFSAEDVAYVGDIVMDYMKKCREFRIESRCENE